MIEEDLQQCHTQEQWEQEHAEKVRSLRSATSLLVTGAEWAARVGVKRRLAIDSRGYWGRRGGGASPATNALWTVAGRAMRPEPRLYGSLTINP